MHLSSCNIMGTVYAMLRHRYVGREQLVAFQNERLRRIVHHAYKEVPYYRDLFDRHGLEPQDIKTVEDLAAVPITTRRDLQALPVRDLIARQVKPDSLITRSSSGSSGRPVVVRRTWLEERVHNAYAFRALHVFGHRLRDTTCTVIKPHVFHTQDHQLIQRILSSCGLFRQEFVNALQTPENLIRTLQALKPAVISGYSGVLARMARIVDDKDLKALQLRFVNTGGEVLTSLMRQQIEKGCGTTVYDTYASIEFHLLAWECRTTGEYHTCDDGVIMEVLRNGVSVAEGERGEVVGTDLHSFAMPLIRYKLGDVVTRGRETCRCGQPFSTIRSIQGRMNDYFVLPGNRVVHPYELGIISMPWIQEFQITQESLNSIIMRVAPLHQPSTQEMDALVQPATRIFGPEVHFHVIIVKEIPMETNGKFRVYRSLVQSAYDGLVWSDQSVQCQKPKEDRSQAQG